jgi:hypothetical protein
LPWTHSKYLWYIHCIELTPQNFLVSCFEMPFLLQAPLWHHHY